MFLKRVLFFFFLYTVFATCRASLFAAETQDEFWDVPHTLTGVQRKCLRDVRVLEIATRVYRWYPPYDCSSSAEVFDTRIQSGLGRKVSGTEAVLYRFIAGKQESLLSIFNLTDIPEEYVKNVYRGTLREWNVLQNLPEGLCYRLFGLCEEIYRNERDVDNIRSQALDALRYDDLHQELNDVVGKAFFHQKNSLSLKHFISKRKLQRWDEAATQSWVEMRAGLSISQSVSEEQYGDRLKHTFNSWKKNQSCMCNVL